MNCIDSISAAMTIVLDDVDTPDDLLPLMIISEAAHLSGLDSDAMVSWRHH